MKKILTADEIKNFKLKQSGSVTLKNNG